MRTDPAQVMAALSRSPGRDDRLVHVYEVAARAGAVTDWPGWVDHHLVSAWRDAGITSPWTHQVEAAELAHAGRHVVMATGTASGKSLGYLMPALTAVSAGRGGSRLRDRGPTVFYLAPTKALAHDQLVGIRALTTDAVPILRTAAVDGDNTREERSWARDHANYIVTNPDMLHRSILPAHSRWAKFLAGLRFVVVDECHAYRGVFGSHVAQVLRRLRRLAEHYGATPTFVLASATVSDPARSAARLTGVEVQPVVDDGSPHGPSTIALWEPPLTEGGGENGAPVRRSATAEAAELLADLVVSDVRTLAFVRSRRGAESVAMGAQRRLEEVAPELARRVTTYRGGYLPEDRRAIEQALRRGELVGLAATSALEMGIDIAGLDAVITAGYPGTRAALWQQFGRAGRDQASSLGVLVARDDPLDTYLVRHPDALLGRPVEATVLDPDNPYVLGPHLCAAAQELPLTDDDLVLFGPSATPGVEALAAAGLLRRRSRGWFWTRPDRASELADIRSTGGMPVQIVAHDTGRLIGTVDAASSHSAVHQGAVYLHQGETYVVERLDLSDSLAVVRRDDPDYSTSAREITQITIVSTEREVAWGRALLSFGAVEVTHQVVSYLRRRAGSGEVLGEEPLDLPERTLTTKAVWWQLPAEVVVESGVSAADLPGAAHAAEHASIGLLPLFATCDRWDIGGVSTAAHPDTGRLTVFVHDGHPGGAGFAERGFESAGEWLATTRDLIADCECEQGCPSCVQSPKCGNGNQPLDKAGAHALLTVLLSSAPPAFL